MKSAGHFVPEVRVVLEVRSVLLVLEVPEDRLHLAALADQAFHVDHQSLGFHFVLVGHSSQAVPVVL